MQPPPDVVGSQPLVSRTLRASFGPYRCLSSSRPPPNLTRAETISGAVACQSEGESNAELPQPRTPCPIVQTSAWVEQWRGADALPQVPAAPATSPRTAIRPPMSHGVDKNRLPAWGGIDDDPNVPSLRFETLRPVFVPSISRGSIDFDAKSDANAGAPQRTGTCKLLWQPEL